MGNFRYILEPFELTELKSSQRTKVKLCPCGRDNKDGKFVPFDGCTARGYCHSCDQTFPAAKHNCPACGESHVFSRYIDTDNADLYLSDEVGKCLACGYHYPPRDFTRTTAPPPRIRPTPRTQKAPPPPPVEVIPMQVLEQSLKQYSGLYDSNHFVQWLTDQSRGACAFTDEIACELIERYYLGNAGKYPGWVLFPYIDHKWRLRQLKLMDYDPTTGGRIKEPQSRVLAIGKKVLKNEQANLQYCLFGEHLLSGNDKPVKIFESEATAIYCSVFYPGAVCLATGGKNGFKFTAENLHPLRGRTVTLYPDLDAYTEWEQKAADLRAMGLCATVSTLLMEQATEYARKYSISVEVMAKGKFDLRDVLKFQDWRPYRTTPPAATTPPEQPPAPEPPPAAIIPPEMDEDTKQAISLLMDAGFEIIHG